MSIKSVCACEGNRALQRRAEPLRFNLFIFLHRILIPVKREGKTSRISLKNTNN